MANPIDALAATDSFVQADVAVVDIKKKNTS